MFDPPPQQLQSVGDLIGRAVRLYRKNYKIFFHVLLWPTVFLTAGKVAFHWGLVNITAKADAKDWTQLGLAAVVALVGLLSLFIVGFILQLRQLAFIRMAAGFSREYKDAYAYISRRKWSIIGLITLAYMAFFGTSIFWMIEMGICAAFFKVGNASTYGAFVGLVLGGFGFFASLAVAGVALYLSLAVGACEELSIGSLFGRTMSLLFSNFWRSSFFCSLLFIVVLTISYPLSLPMVLVSIFEFVRQGMSTEFLTDPQRMPFYYTLFNQSWESIVSIITWPISFMAVGLFYYDLRMRQEGIDLIDRINTVNLPVGALNESVS